MKRRMDIDGLRALAILPVVAEHVGFRLAPGGFIGVDVFFVISGFLIGSIIMESFSRGTFSYLDFYDRRIRRIGPALLVMLLFVTVTGFLVLLPKEYESLSASVIAAIVSVSNLYFWATTNYFAAAAETKPLLHTWSLGVEEQFYLLLPVLLTFVMPKGKTWLRVVLWGLTAVSFALCVALLGEHAAASFYSPFSRIWELLLGVLLATGCELRESRWVRQVSGALGVGLIVGAIFWLSPGVPFPGAIAAIPVVGTLLIIWSGRESDTWVAKAFSWGPLVFIGLISYSLYLWHWPIIVFVHVAGLPFAAQLGLPREGTVLNIIIVVLSLIAATLSWKFVEQPFRLGRGPVMSRRTVFVSTGVLASVIIAWSVAVQGVGGFPSRFKPEAVEVASFINYTVNDGRGQDRCFIEQPGDQFDAKGCLAPSSSQRNILMLGDSHAASLWQGVVHRQPESKVMLAASSGCRPTIVQGKDAPAHCVNLYRYIYDQYLPTARVSAVVLDGRWHDDDLPRLRTTLEHLRRAGKTTVLVGPIPEYDVSLPRLLAVSIEQNDKALPQHHLRRGIWDLDRRMAKIAADYGVRYVSMVNAICPNQACEVYAAPGVPMYFDYGHLTRQGAIVAASKAVDGFAQTSN